MFGLAPRPGFRPKARTPPNAPSGARDDEEPRQTEFDLQGQLLRCHAPSRVLAGEHVDRTENEAHDGDVPTTPEPSFARSIDELMDALEQALRDVAEYARDGFAVDEFLKTSGLFLAAQGHCGPARGGRAVVAGVRRRAT